MKKYINLLPPAQQRELKNLRLTQQVRDFGILLGVSLAVLAMLFVALRFYLKGELANSQDRLAAEQNLLNNLETSSFRDQLDRFNAELVDFKFLQSKKENNKFSAALLEIAQKIPRDLTVDRFALDEKTGKIEIGGRAANRSSVLSFRRSLAASDLFTNVNFPLANLETPRDLPWQYRLYLKAPKNAAN